MNDMKVESIYEIKIMGILLDPVSRLIKKIVF